MNEIAQIAVSGSGTPEQAELRRGTHQKMSHFWHRLGSDMHVQDMAPRCQSEMRCFLMEYTALDEVLGCRTLCAGAFALECPDLGFLRIKTELYLGDAAGTQAQPVDLLLAEILMAKGS